MMEQILEQMSGTNRIFAELLVADFKRKESQSKMKKRIKNRLKEQDKAKKRRSRFKQKCVDYKGGKCAICGYDKCLAALDFHHVNPTLDDIRISKIFPFKFNVMIQKELDKCILLCSNCHREFHSGLTDLQNVV